MSPASPPGLVLAAVGEGIEPSWYWLTASCMTILPPYNEALRVPSFGRRNRTLVPVVQSHSMEPAPYPKVLELVELVGS